VETLAVTDEQVVGRETGEHSRRERTEGGVDADALVPDQEEVGRPEGFRNDEDARLVAVECGLVPAEPVDDRVRGVAGVGEVVAKPLDGSLEVLGDPVERLREVNGNVVAAREGGGVARVPIEQDDDAGDRAVLGQDVVDSLGLDGVDHPDVAVVDQCVAGPQHVLRRVGDPAHAAVEAVDRLPLPGRTGRFQGHVTSLGRVGEKRLPNSQGGGAAPSRTVTTVGTSYFTLPVEPERMTQSILSEDVAGIAAALQPEPDAVLQEMHDRAERDGFPHVGPTVGGWLALLTRLAGATRAFEFGSGFGYSAYWIARELPTAGEVVLTEVDEDEIALAAEYFESAGLGQRARFVQGDAMDVVESTEGPFDLVLIDHEKERYRDAFEAVRPKVESGGLVVADNAVTAGHVDPSDVRAVLAGEDPPDATDASRGVGAYLARVRDDEAFASGLLPLGEGLSVSMRL